MKLRVSWVIPRGCYELLSMQFKRLGRGKKSANIWGDRLFPGLFWVIWMERNRRIFEDYSGSMWMKFGIECVLGLNLQSMLKATVSR